MPEVSVVIPARNEESNMNKLLMSIMMTLKGYDYEAVVVDDSDDATAFVAESLGANVIVGQRKGLGQAIIDGINGSSGDIVVVMDADGSHSPSAIPDLLKPILEQGADFVIGSRYVAGGDYSNWAIDRKIKSIIGVKLMQLVTGITDSNSGFFALKKSILDGVELKPHSWKIMLEVLFKGNWLFKKEVPITFNDRTEGVSKNSNKERLRHATHMLKLLVYKFRRYIKFALTGGVGAIWYFTLLYCLTEFVGLWYILSSILATLVAITNNYFINHFWTFRKERQHNKSKFRGWGKYVVTSGIGDGIDLGVLFLLTEFGGLWYMLSAFIASGVASVIKFTIAKSWVWKAKGKSANDADYEWHSYFKGFPWQRYWKHRIANAVVKLSGDAGKVIDLGCGSSPAGLLTNHSHYVGIDPNVAKMEYMQGKNLRSVEYKVGKAEGLNELISGEFDTILFIETIEHLNGWEDVHKALEQISQATVANGNVIIATPNYGSWLGRLQDKLYGVFQPSGYADEHRVKFDLNTLRAICLKHGLVYENDIIPFNMDMVVKFKKILI